MSAPGPQRLPPPTHTCHQQSVQGVHILLPDLRCHNNYYTLHKICSDAEHAQTTDMQLQVRVCKIQV